LTSKDAEWEQSLAANGLNRPTITAIMDSEYRDVRLTRGCGFWALDKVENRYYHLLLVKDQSWQRAAQAQRSAQRAGRENRPPIEDRLPGMAVGASGLVRESPEDFERFVLRKEQSELPGIDYRDHRDPPYCEQEIQSKH
jgi:hypothetical protein